MRIALFSWESSYSVHVGGVAVHVSELACALERKGHEVHVFTRLGQNFQQRYENIHGVHYHRCPFDMNSDFVEEIQNMCRSFVHHFFETEDFVGRFDVVHAHDWLTVPALEWIKNGRGHKSIFTIHSTEYGRCGNNNFGGNSERVRHIEWNGTYCADRVVAVSKFLRNEVRHLYQVPDDKITAIYNGVNPRHYDGWIDSPSIRRMYGIGEHDPMVLFSGRLVFQKGPDLLIEGIRHVLDHVPEAKFVIAGDGEMRGDVEHLAREYGIAHATRFMGYMSGWQLIDLYKACDCVCVPSRNEPFGIVILEAWSSGKPVIATSIGGPSEIVWHEVNGLKINAHSDSVAWGIGTMISDLQKARWMGHNGRVSAETAFSWDTIADEVIGLYSN